MGEYAIQFSRSPTLTGRAIGFWTWSWVSHVDFVLPSGALLGAVAGKGVVFHKPRNLLDYVRVEKYTVRDPRLADAVKLAATQVGKPYDWKAILGIAIRRDWHNTDAWICSELIAWACMEAGVPLINAQPNRVTPRDLLVSPLLIPVTIISK